LTGRSTKTQEWPLDSSSDTSNFQPAGLCVLP
jgi:hypothetical protein